jgi:hypothetical protein
VSSAHFANLVVHIGTGIIALAIGHAVIARTKGTGTHKPWGRRFCDTARAIKRFPTMTLKSASLLLLLGFSSAAFSQEGRPAFLFLGSYHMNNHSRDMFNVNASDVTSAERQREILQVVYAIEAYHPTKIMIERDVADQAEIRAQLQETCDGKRPASKEEYEQIGFRLACRLRIPVVAVNYNELGPIQDPKKIDLGSATSKEWEELKTLGESDNNALQRIERTESVGNILKYLNSDAKTQETASRYYLLAKIQSPTERVGANWVQYWYGRNLVIFNNIVANTVPGDRVLVIYGYGHGYILRHMAEESLKFDVLNTETYLDQRL